MKKLYLALFAVLLVCVVGTAVFLIVTPDRVPVHYGLDGRPDRLGSKYENAICPAVAVVMCAVFVFAAGKERKKKEKSNEKVILIVALCSLVFFTALSFFILKKALSYDPGAAEPVSFDDIGKLIGVGLGALLALLGAVTAKAKKNSVIGLRTKWSMANDTVWEKSQRAGGAVCVVCGVCMTALSVFVRGIWSFILPLLLLTVCLILCLIVSRGIFLRYKDEADK